jgi:hypothetical protein
MVGGMGWLIGGRSTPARRRCWGLGRGRDHFAGLGGMVECWRQVHFFRLIRDRKNEPASCHGFVVGGATIFLMLGKWWSCPIFLHPRMQCFGT